MDNSHLEEHLSQEGSLASAHEVNGTPEDDEKYRSIIQEALAGLKVDEEPELELSTTSAIEGDSPALDDLDDGRFDHHIDFDHTSEGYAWDSKDENASASRPWATLDRSQRSPRLSNYLQDPGPPQLPQGLYNRQVLESAAETIRRPEPPASAMVSVSDSTAQVLVDLKNRVEDWKGHEPEQFGELIFHEVLLITRSDHLNQSKTYHVYFFERILLCCKATGPSTKKRFRKSKMSDKTGLWDSQLNLKGRILMSSVKDVVSHSKNGHYSMQVFWKNESTEESFSIHFDDEDTMRTWIWHFNLQPKACNPLTGNILCKL